MTQRLKLADKAMGMSGDIAAAVEAVGSQFDVVDAWASTYQIEAIRCHNL